MAENLKYRDYIFWWICFCAPFISMNRNLFPWGSFFGGGFSHDLVAWPLLAGVLYSLYMQWKGNRVFVYNKWIVAFICGTLLIELISIVHGAYIFPYWDLVDSASLPGKSRVGIIVSILQEHGWLSNEIRFQRYFLFYSSIKDAFFKVVVSYGGMYMIYCWYRDDYKRAISVMEKAVLTSTLLLFVYCAVELLALLGDSFFQYILFKMDMIIHLPEMDKVAKVEQWLKYWVVGSKQMRGYFAEPSLLGMYANVMASFLWYRILKDSSKWAIVCNLILGVIVVLTSSRAAVGIYCAMLALLIVVLLYKREKQLFIKGGVIVISSVLAFSVGTFLIKNIILDSNNRVLDSNNKVLDSNNKVLDSNKHASYVKSDIEGYFESNVGSLADVKARSNPARYTYLYCAFKTGMEYPILGVGNRFYPIYALEAIPEWGRNVSEVKRNAKTVQEKGILEGTFPVFNEYLQTFATKGIIGLTWYMLPFGFIIYKVLRMLVNSLVNEIITYILLIELLLGIALDGFNFGFNTFYSSWITLAIAILSLKNMTNEQNETFL